VSLGCVSQTDDSNRPSELLIDFSILPRRRALNEPDASGLFCDAVLKQHGGGLSGIGATNLIEHGDWVI
jgi:hypothetical protein